jgi:hypothetical protein
LCHRAGHVAGHQSLHLARYAEPVLALQQCDRSPASVLANGRVSCQIAEAAPLIHDGGASGDLGPGR